MTYWGGEALVKLVGTSRGADLLLTAQKVFSEEALPIGLVNRAVDKNNVLNEAITIAEQIAVNGPNAVLQMLMLVRNSKNISYDESLRKEAEQAVLLIVSGECFHGVSAFLEKRKPEFPDV